MNSLFKKSVIVAAIASICVFAAGCGSSSDKAAADTQKKEIKIGVSAGPHAEVMDEVKKEAAKQGINIKVVEFNDYVQPNLALNDGELDANFFQHLPYLEEFNKNKNTELVKTVNVHLEPMGLYSSKINRFHKNI